MADKLRCPKCDQIMHHVNGNRVVHHEIDGLVCTRRQLADRDRRLKVIEENYETVLNWAGVALSEYDDPAGDYDYEKDKRSVSAIWAALNVPDPRGDPEANKT